MAGGLESLTRYAAALPNRRAAAESSEAVGFATVLADGEGIIIDGKFVLAYKIKDGNRGQRVGKVALITGKGVPVYRGTDKDHLKKHVVPEEFQGPLDVLHFKPHDPYRIVNIDGYELHITEAFMFTGPSEGANLHHVLQVGSSTRFGFERIDGSANFFEMQERLIESTQA